MEDIFEKANYCLNCKIKPCSNKGCPLGNNIPEFINQIKKNDIKKAYKILSETTVLPGICGRVCPHYKQCQGSCIRSLKGESVSIGELESFVFDKMIEEDNSLLNCYSNEMEKRKINNSIKVAVIGGGPAGLTASAFLAKGGMDVTIFEKNNYLGGILVHGIPEFRLQNKIIKKTIEKILKLGIKVKYNMALGGNITLEELEKKYDFIFLSIGANKSIKMEIEGEDLKGVYGGNELLEYNIHPDYTGKKVAIIGGRKCSNGLRKNNQKTWSKRGKSNI